MIFICVGSREYQFNRLISEIDNLINKGIINDDVFGQIGQSTYIPKFFKYTRFTNKVEFEHYVDIANIIITHGGTGSIIGALKKGKKVIVVPRLKKYNEHIDDHQMQISSVLSAKNHIIMVTNIEELGAKILHCLNDFSPVKYKNDGKIIEIIEEYIENK